MKKRTVFVIGRRTRRVTTLIVLVRAPVGPPLPGPWSVCAVVSPN